MVRVWEMLRRRYPRWAMAVCPEIQTVLSRYDAKSLHVVVDEASPSHAWKHTGSTA